MTSYEASDPTSLAGKKMECFLWKVCTHIKNYLGEDKIGLSEISSECGIFSFSSPTNILTESSSKINFYLTNNLYNMVEVKF